MSKPLGCNDVLDRIRTHLSYDLCMLDWRISEQCLKDAADEIERLRMENIGLRGNEKILRKELGLPDRAERE